MSASAVTRRDLMFGVAMGAAGLAGFASRPHAETGAFLPGALDRLVPTAVGEWQYGTTNGVIIPPSEDEPGGAYDQIIVRSYGAPNQPNVMLLIAYGSGEHGLSQVHRPEACYPSFGFTMSNKRPVELPIGGGRAIPATFYTASSNERVEQLVYWTRVGERYPTSWREQTVDLALANFRGVAPDGVLLRLSIMGGDPDMARAVIGGFHAELMKSISPAGRRALLGEA